MPTAPVHCLLFGPGLKKSGEPATAQVVGDALELRRADGATRTIDLALTQLRRVGFDGQGLEIAWRDHERGGRETYACHVLDRAAADRLLAVLPGQLAADKRDLARLDEQQRLKQRIGFAALALFLALPLLLFALFLANIERLVDLVVQRIPPAQEQALAEGYIAEFDADPTMRREGPRYRAAEQILARLVAEDSRYDYTLYIADDPQVNAFALPGGVVVVNDGLIEATNHPKELAGVLAHEVQHVELRHGVRAVVKQAGLAVAVALVTGDASGTLAGEATRQLAGLKFSRDAEREADQTGFDRLVHSGIDPSGMVSFFETLDEAGAQGVEFLSTHPASDDRAARLQRRLDTLTTTFTPLDLSGSWPPPES